MLTFDSELTIMLSVTPIDMRLGIDGLTRCVVETLAQQPQRQCLFLFCNKQGNKVKGICWHKNGFILIYKRLERGRFKLPKPSQTAILEIDHQQLSWLLAGFDFVRMADYPELNFSDYG